MIRFEELQTAGLALCHGIAWAGLGVALQSTLLLALGLLAGRALRRHGPALASLIYQATLAAVLLSALGSVSLGGCLRPLWRVALPGASLRAAQRAPVEGTAKAPNDAKARKPFAAKARRERRGERVGEEEPMSASPLLPVPPDFTPSLASPLRAHVDFAPSPPSRFRISVVAVAGGWGGGVLLLLGWLLLCQMHLGRLRRSSVPLREGAAAAALGELCRSMGLREPLLLASPEARSPFLAGVWRPAIVLPAGCEQEFDGPALRAILTHELVHLARRDCAWNLGARLACALLWPQPLLWVLCRQMEQASEEVCDQEVVRREVDPRAYARCLLALSDRLLPSAVERAMGVGVVPFRSELGRRIRQIMDRSRPRPLSPRGRAAVLLGAGAAVALALLLLPAGATLPPAGSDASSGSDRTAGVVAAGPGSATREQAGSPRRSPLAGVPELAQPVTYTETRIPLGELVQKVAADTGVPLTASAGVADEPVAVVVRELPARELLEQLADLLDYQWRVPAFRRSGVPAFGRANPTDPTDLSDSPERPNARTPGRPVAYEIYQDMASKRREEALRQAAVAAAWRRLGEQIPQYVRMAARPPAAIDQLVEEQKRWYEHLFQLPYAERLAVSRRDRALQKEFLMAEQLASPVTRGEATLLGQLTPAQWALLRQGRPLVFSTEPQHGEIPLPDAIARALHGAQPRMGDETHYGSPEFQREMRERRQELKTAWAEANGYQVRIALDTSQLQTEAQLSLQAAAIPLRGGRPAMPAGSLPANGAMLDIGVGPAFVFQWDTDEADEKASAARHALLEKDPVFGAKKTVNGAQKLGRPEGPYWKGDPSVGELFAEIARVYGVSVISDSYAWDRTMVAPSIHAPIALCDLLDDVAGDWHVWDRVPTKWVIGRLVRFRYRNWPFARPKEVPMRRLRRWQALLDRDGALPLTEWLSAVTTLTDPQLDTLHQIVLFNGPSAFFTPVDPRYALRLYISLTPVQQQALWQGRPLPVASMTPAQQALFLETLRDQAQTRLGIPVSSGNPAIGPEAAFSLTSDRKVWVFKQHGNWTGIHYEPVSETPPAAPPRSPSPTEQATVTRRTITTVTFQFRSGTGVEENVPLYVASPA